MEATWDTLLSSATQQAKVETSPTGSLLSDPAGVYPSLFSGSTVASSAAATPTDTGVLSLGLFPPTSDDIDFASKSAAFQSSLASLAEEVSDESDPLVVVEQENTEGDATTASDKKPAKKRKSWGQVLPEPKTNLPPRKRAKTEDEKEQRRVERVLRNRRAAQSSRERKRLEVEALEIRNRELEEQLAKVRRENTMLYERLTQVQGKSAVVPTANTPVTLSQELFGSQNGHTSFTTESSSDLGSIFNSATINPVSLSPTLHPIPDTSDVIATIGDDEVVAQDASEKTEQETKTEQLPSQKQSQPPLAEPVAANSTDSLVAAKLEPSPDTTHRPAATLCPDLQYDLASNALFHNDFSMLPAVESDSFAHESGYLDSPDSGNSDFNYLVDNDAIAAINGSAFDIDDFLNADGPGQPSGGNFLLGDCGFSAAGSAFLHSAAQDTSEDPDQQPHAGASY
ncbi:transcription factor that binds to CRE motif [Sporothrix curviconia]|uniref:Transcription factor that binds to CRE motif n=1 Tax=Sporothrix curviconia TaxID=1260050 RepID=A0ABP0C5A1_9PEZI